MYAIAGSKGPSKAGLSGLALALLLAVAACATAPPVDKPVFTKAIPQEMWQSAIPADAPMTADRVALGRQLFFDKRLSVNDSVSCASCHNPRFGFTDGRRVSVGVGGKTGARHAPTILNAMFNPQQFWDGRADSLEAQAKGPLTNKLEMAMPSEAAVVTKVAGLPGYQGRFEAAFGRPVCMDDIAEALACFERMQVSGDAPFDRYMAGDKHAISAAAVRGYALFKGSGRCNQCHTYTATSPFFTDFSFHNTGVGASGCKNFESMAGDMFSREADHKLDRRVLDELALTPGSSELGRFLVTVKTKHLGAFKTPTLRDVEVRAPYMHDGNLKTLRAVLEYYNRGCKDNCNLDKALCNSDRTPHLLKLKANDLDDLEAFLKSLTGDRTRRLVAGQEQP